MAVKALKRKKLWAVRKSTQVKRARQTMPLYKSVGMPRRLTLTMNYVDEPLFSSGVVGTVTHIYRGNSIFDPDFTGAGHQPLGHDQWATLYNRYRVTKSKITVMWTNTSQQEQHYLLLPQNANTTPGFTDAAESVGSKLGVISAFDGRGNLTLTSTATTLGIKGDRNLTNDKDLEALFGANPNTQWFWVLQVKSPGATAVDSRAFVKIEYTVEIFDRKSLTQS